MIFCQNLLLLLAIIVTTCSYAQTVTPEDETTHQIQPIPSKYIDIISSKAGQLDQKLDKKTEKALLQWQKQENKIRRKLARKDSIKASLIFANATQHYNQLEQRLKKATSLQRFIPSFDTMVTSVKFLQQSPQLLTGAKGAQQKINHAISKVNGLEQRFQKAEEVKIYLKERKQFLRDNLQSLGFAKELKKISKINFYYRAQVAEYAETLKDHKKAEKKAIQLLSKTKVFKNFMRKNSFLARLFPIPQDDPSSFGGAGGGLAGAGAAGTGFAGLQTRQQVSSFIQQVGLSGPNATSQMQRSIQDAQSQLTELRNKIAQLGGAGGDDLEMPDFKIRRLKTKPLFKRLEYAANFHSQNADRFFPKTSVAGLSIGYRLDERSVIGIGANYELGLGNGWKNIRLTHEGIQFISFVDWKIDAASKGERRERGGNFWISGGYEQVYRARFKRIDELKDLNAWQQNLLLGVSKTVSLKTKFFKNTKFRLLWNCFAFKQVPKTKPLLFRVSYNF